MPSQSFNSPGSLTPSKGSSRTSSSRDLVKIIIAGSAGGSFILICALVVVLVQAARRRKHRQDNSASPNDNKNPDVRRSHTIGHQPTPSDVIALSPLLARYGADPLARDSFPSVNGLQNRSGENASQPSIAASIPPEPRRIPHTEFTGPTDDLAAVPKISGAARPSSLASLPRRKPSPLTTPFATASSEALSAQTDAQPHHGIPFPDSATLAESSEGSVWGTSSNGSMSTAQAGPSSEYDAHNAPSTSFSSSRSKSGQGKDLRYRGNRLPKSRVYKPGTTRPRSQSFSESTMGSPATSEDPPSSAPPLPDSMPAQPSSVASSPSLRSSRGRSNRPSGPVPIVPLATLMDLPENFNVEEWSAHTLDRLKMASGFQQQSRRGHDRSSPLGSRSVGGASPHTVRAPSIASSRRSSSASRRTIPRPPPQPYHFRPPPPPPGTVSLPSSPLRNIFRASVRSDATSTLI